VTVGDNEVTLPRLVDMRKVAGSAASNKVKGEIHHTEIVPFYAMIIRLTKHMVVHFAL